MYLFLIAIAFLGFIWIAKIDTKDRKARKEAVKITAVITGLRCKQRLKGDKSHIKLIYNNKEYTVYLKKEADCLKYQLHQQVMVYYSKTYDKVFLFV